MLQKGNKLYSIFRLKCPRCHEGELFENNRLLTYQKTDAMPESCPKCGQKYELEEGFWYGAMFVSYSLSSIYLIAFLLVALVTGEALWLYGAIALLFICWPVIFRLSRSLYLNIFVHYDEDLTP